MTSITEAITLRTLPRKQAQPRTDVWRSLAHKRMDMVMATAKEVSFDDNSRIVFFSDCHRGDNSGEDVFVPNKPLYMQALNHYWRQGYTYVEVGDGDELWSHWSFADIHRAHGDVFDLLHRFARDRRLHLIVGNHDIRGSRHERVQKGGLTTQESLVLRHKQSGHRILVVHGHQADFNSERLFLLSRFVVRYVATRLPFRTKNGKPVEAFRRLGRIEQRIIQWAQSRRQMVICGHTHRPMLAAYGAPPYFNAGSCLYPGYITGLEIRNGEIALVRWSAQVNGQQSTGASRDLLVAPRQLAHFAPRTGPVH